MTQNKIKIEYAMRTIVYTMVIYLFPWLTTIAQSTDMNYVKSVFFAEQLEVGGIADRGGLDNITHTTELTFYNGLGWPIQTIKTSSGKAVTNIIDYDTCGRISNNWINLPAYENYSYMNENARNNSAKLFYGDTQAFSTNLYDALGHIIEIKTAGTAWKASQKGKSIKYGVNSEREVKWYKAPMDKVSLVYSGFYPPEALTSETTTDEDGKSLSVFKDFHGNKVLERRDDNNDTYYVYDDIGRLRYVLQPEYQKSGYKNMYAFEYRYDVKGRIVKKILPGCEYIQYWYDDADRVAFMQDATLRSCKKYRFYFYDPFNRIALQGLCSSCNRNEGTCMATYRKNSTGLLDTGYELSITDKINDATLEIACYYDDYDFLRLSEPWAGSFKDSLKISDEQSATGNLTGCLQFASDKSPLLKVLCYDYRSRIVCDKEVFNKTRLIVQCNEYTFTDKLKKQIICNYNTVNGNTVCINRNDLVNVFDKKNEALVYTDFTVYDKEMTAHTQRIKSYDYDNIGRIRSVMRGGNAGRIDYAYNLHGWTTNIDSKDFHEELHYTDGVGKPYYNGNISSQLWSTSDNGQVRGYKFEYDGLDRLKEAVYGETPSLSDKQNRYNEKVVEYTANGAMKRFQRRGLKDDGEYGKIDNLNIKLDGNRLLNVTDDALPANKYSSFNFIDGANEQVEYEYNGVGALTKDLNRGITITYDNLNNPRRIDFNDGNSITYTYLPDGTLLRKGYGEKLNQRKSSANVPVSDSLATAPGQIILADSMAMVAPGFIVYGNTEYSGNILYHDGRLDKVLFPGGYCTLNKETNEPTFHYFTQDHLGNNRVVTNEDGTVEQITHYYPFGGTFNDAGLNAGLQQYKYTGKELDRIAGLNTYDYGARQYFPTLPMWDRMDPKCEEDYGISPYAYCRNNPIRMFDNDGKRPGDFFLTMDDAAIDFGLFYNDNSIRENREYGTFIYRVTNKSGVSGYSYSFATIGEKESVTIGNVPIGHFPAAVIHTHGSSTFSMQREFYDNEFSGIRRDDKEKALKTTAEKKSTKDKDIGFSNNRKLNSYLVTPNGTLQKYNYKTGKIKVISHDMPSDKNDPDRVNTVQSDFETKPLSTLDILNINKNILYEEY